MRGGLAKNLIWALIWALICSIAQPVSAFDVEVDSDTSFQVYEVRSPGARGFMARRRLVSRLAFRLTHDFTEPDADGRVIRLTAAAQLRLEQEFGETCLVDRELCVNATDANDPTEWQPLAADTRLDVPAIWVRVTGLPLGTSATAGRQLQLDRIGFVRFDGGTVHVAPIRWLRTSGYAGRLVTGTTLGGTPRSDIAGSIRLDDAARIRFAAEPADIFVAGATIGGGLGRWLQLDAGIRHMWEDAGDVVSRLSLAASSTPLDWLRIDAGGVFDLITDEVIAADARLALGDGELRVRAGVERRLPRFDPGTIWAWFNVAPITQADLGAVWVVSPDFTLGGSVRGRVAELGENSDDDLDVGLDGWFTARWEGLTFGASGFGWTGALGPLAGVSVDLRRRFLGWLELSLDISVWHFDHPYQQSVFGTVVSEALTGTARLSPETSVFIELQHAASERIGNRFRGTLALRVDTWR